MRNATARINPRVLSPNRTPSAMTSAWLEVDPWGSTISTSKWSSSPNNWDSSAFTASDWLCSFLVDQTARGQKKSVTWPFYTVIFPWLYLNIEVNFYETRFRFQTGQNGQNSGKLLKINITQTNEFQASLLKNKTKQYWVSNRWAWCRTQ